MKKIRFILHDTYQGMRYNSVKFFLAVLIGLIGAVMYLKMYKLINNNFDGATFLQCLAYTYKGGKYIPPEMLKDAYTLPALWLCIQIVVGYLVGYYPVDDLHTYGQQILIRSRKRTTWWLSKCIWNMLTVVLTYIIIDATMFIVCFAAKVDITGGISESDLMGQVFEMFMYTGTTRNVIIFVVVMPVIVSIAVSQLQMMLGIICSPMIGFIVVEAWALLATFSVSGLCIHNYGALSHTIICCPSNIKYSTGCVVCLGVALASVIAGGIYFNRSNILAKE